MLKLLSTFAALSLCGTVILSVLPDGGLKRTAGMAVGLMTLLCWAEGIASLLNLEFFHELPQTVLSPTFYSMSEAAAEASRALESVWEVSP